MFGFNRSIRTIVMLVLSVLGFAAFGSSGAMAAGGNYVNPTWSATVTNRHIVIHVKNKPLNDDPGHLLRMIFTPYDETTKSLYAGRIVPNGTDDAFDTFIRLKFPAYSGTHHIVLQGTALSKSGRQLYVTELGAWDVVTNLGPRAVVHIYPIVEEGSSPDSCAADIVLGSRTSVVNRIYFVSVDPLSSTRVGLGFTSDYSVRAGQRFVVPQFVLKHKNYGKGFVLTITLKNGTLVRHRTYQFPACS